MKAFVVKRGESEGFLTRSYKSKESLVKRGVLPRLIAGEVADVYGVDFFPSFVVSKPQIPLLEVAHERSTRSSKKAA